MKSSNYVRYLKIKNNKKIILFYLTDSLTDCLIGLT